MSHLAIYLLALSALSPALSIRSPAAGLQDLAAFPKYEVQFLNELPLAASDADRCRAEGIVVDDDFLELRPRSPATIDGSEGEGEQGSSTSPPPRPKTLELVTLHYTPPGSDGGAHTYLCAMPSTNTTAEQSQTATHLKDEPDPDPVASWQALKHLDGQCLYARHTWFTYAYCHNNYIRQFREAVHTVPAPPEGYTPKEDPMFDAYTLGQAHPQKRSKGALPPGQRRGGTVAQRQAAQAHAQDHGHGHHDDLAPEQTVTLGVSPASRYLVQRWTDGTRCDKTGRPREVEVQVHCSMTSGDAIYMVKEIDICKYVMVIHSPHLCSLPGFRPQTADDIVPAPIRCREVVDDDEFTRWETEPHVFEDEEARLRLPDRPAEVNAEALAQQAQSQAQAESAGRKLNLANGVVGMESLGLDLQRKLEEIIKNSYSGGDVKDDEAHYGDAGDDGHVDQVSFDDVADMVVLTFAEDEAGEMQPVEVDSVLHVSGEERRGFLEKLQALIDKELNGDDGEDKAVRNEEKVNHDEL